MIPEQPFTTQSHNDLHQTINLIKVFVGDFIGCTDDWSTSHLLNLTQAMLHGVHSIFPPPKVTGHNRGDPISEKKLHKLEGLWSHTKEILGWIIDGANYTIQLPSNKTEKITKTLKALSCTKHIALLPFQKLVGTLLHAAIGIPGGRGLFTQIWAAMAKQTNGWITVPKDLKAIFSDFRWLFKQIANVPINVAQIVPWAPEKLGHIDTCKYAVGGVYHYHPPTMSTGT
jgi:hypothetical protein